METTRSIRHDRLQILYILCVFVYVCVLCNSMWLYRVIFISYIKRNTDLVCVCTYIGLELKVPDELQAVLRCICLTCVSNLSGLCLSIANLCLGITRMPSYLHPAHAYAPYPPLPVLQAWSLLVCNSSACDFTSPVHSRPGTTIRWYHTKLDTRRAVFTFFRSRSLCQLQSSIGGRRMSTVCLDYIQV